MIIPTSQKMAKIFFFKKKEPNDNRNTNSSQNSALSQHQTIPFMIEVHMEETITE